MRWLVRTGVVKSIVFIGLVALGCELDAQSPVADAKPGQRAPKAALPPGVLYQLGNSYFRGDCRLTMAVFSPDGKYLAAGDDEATIWIWNVETGQEVKRLTVAPEDVRQLWFANKPVELHCFTATRNTAHAHHHWQYPDWSPLPGLSVRQREIPVFQKRSDPNRTRDVGEGLSDPIVVRDVDTSAELLSVPRLESTCIPRLSRDGKLLAIDFSSDHGRKDRIQVWDVDQGKKLQEFATESTLFSQVAISPDDAVLTAAGNGVRSWDLKTGRELPRPDSKQRVLGQLQFAPDGKQIATAVEGAIEVVEVATGKRVYSLPAPVDVFGLFYSPNGKLLAVQGPSPAVLVFDLRTGKELHPHEGLLGPVGDAAFSRDGKRMATIDGGDQYMVVWDLASRRPIGTARVADPLFGPPLAAKSRLSDDGRLGIVRRSGALPWLWKIDDGPFVPREVDWQPEHLVAAASRHGAFFAAVADGSLEFLTWGVAGHLEQTHRVPFPGHAANVLAVAMSADARFAASVADDRTLQIWNIKAPKPPVKIVLQHMPQPVLAMSDDGTQVAAIVGRQLTVWKSTGGDPVASMELADDQPTVLRFAPDGKSLALGTVTGRLRLCDPAGGKTIAERLAHPGGVTALEFSGEGAVLYSGGRDGAIVSSQGTTLEKIATLDDKLAPILSLAPFADGKSLAASDESNAVVTWDTTTGKRTKETKRPLPGQLLFIFPDGNGLGQVVNIRGKLQISLTTNWLGNGFGTVPHQPLFAEPVAFSPDGKLVARATPAGIRTWRTDTGESAKRLPASAFYGQTMGFSASGRLLVAGGDGLAVWKLDADAPAWAIPREKTGEVAQVLFSPDERFVLSSQWDDRDKTHAVIKGTTEQVVPYLSYDHDVSIWNVASGKLVRSIRLPRSNFGEIQFSGDGRLLVASVVPYGAANTGRRPPEKRLVIWETATGNRLGEVPLPYSAPSSCALSADGRGLALGLPNGTIWVCDFPQLLKPLVIAADPGDAAPLAELWNRLGSDDPVVAYRAINRMCDQPEAAVKFLRERLAALAETAEATDPTKVAKPAVPDDIQALIKQLGSDDRRVQRQASARLLQLGPAIHAELRAALKASPSEQVRGRLELILAAGKSTPQTASSQKMAPLQVTRAVQVLEQIANPAARGIVKALASGPTTSELTAEAQAAAQRLASLPQSVP